LISLLALAIFIASCLAANTARKKLT